MRVGLAFFSLGKSMAKAASRVRGTAGAGVSRSGRDGESAMASKFSIATSQLLPHCSTTSRTVAGEREENMSHSASMDSCAAMAAGPLQKQEIQPAASA
jgi:hypothetical protein